MVAMVAMLKAVAGEVKGSEGVVFPSTSICEPAGPPKTPLPPMSPISRISPMQNRMMFSTMTNRQSLSAFLSESSTYQ